MAEFDWNDVRFFLAVARDGSTLNASRALNVSQPTVARRISALEEALGMTLFERLQTGYRVNEHGTALLPRFEEVEAAAEGLESAARLQAREISGVIRITTSEALANLTLSPVLPEFHRRYPHLRVELIASDQFLDIGAGEADIAIRGASVAPSDPELVIRRLGGHHWALYASRGYIASHGRPTEPSDLNHHRVIGSEGPFGDLCLEWLMREAPRAEVQLRCSSLLNAMTSIRWGLGLGFLPFSFFPDEDLVCCIEVPELTTSIWLVTHERLRNVPRVRAFLDFAAAYNLAGRAAPTV
jgi:DNA-binding transcriptional LysR family regulator